MSDQPKPTDEWTVRPVHKNDGTVWPGIGYISDGNRTYGSANWEEGKAIVAAINAALAAEEERVTREIFDAYCDDPTEGAMRAKEKEIQQLREQIAAEREKVRKLRCEVAAWKEPK